MTDTKSNDKALSSADKTLSQARKVSPVGVATGCILGICFFAMCVGLLVIALFIIAEVPFIHDVVANSVCHG